MKKTRIGILTGGGDCAGLNPAIKWVVKSALDERLEAERGVQYEVLGIRDGWRGLIDVDPESPACGDYVAQGVCVLYLVYREKQRIVGHGPLWQRPRLLAGGDTGFR